MPAGTLHGMRPLIDRMLAWLARFVLRGFFRSVEVVGRERIPRDQPLLVVANHYNALVDAALLAFVLKRVPRFLAKATLWRSALARPLLALAGMVPVSRRQDQPDSVDERANQSAFGAAHRVLGRRSVVAIFPEGMVSRVPMLAPLKTGAARIALGARAGGAEDLAIVPVGLVYEDRVAMRSRVLVRVGEPIHLDEDLEALVESGAEADQHDTLAVRRLTEEIESRLRRVVPDYRDEREAAVLGRAAEIAQRSRGRGTLSAVPLQQRETLAQRISRAPRELRSQILDAVARYELDLSLLGLRDEYLVAGYRAPELLRLVLSTALRLALLAPFAIVGAAINMLPYWAVHWTGRIIRNPLLKATGRLLSGLLLFPVAWLMAVWIAPWEGWLPNLGVLIASPILGLIAVRALERAVAVRRAWRGWVAMAERSGSLGQVRQDRERLLQMVEAATHAADDITDGGQAGRAATEEGAPPSPMRDA